MKHSLLLLLSYRYHRVCSWRGRTRQSRDRFGLGPTQRSAGRIWTWWNWPTANQFLYWRLCVPPCQRCGFQTQFSPWITQKPSFICRLLICTTWCYWVEHPVSGMFCWPSSVPSGSLLNSPQMCAIPQESVSSSAPVADHNSTFIARDVVDARDVFRAIWWVWRTKMTKNRMKTKHSTWLYS